MKSIFLDSDIFVRELRYPHDHKSVVNRKLLKKVKTGQLKAVTSIFNVLEVCGILSYNLNHEELLTLYGEFCHKFNVKVLLPADKEANLLYHLPEVMAQIFKKQNLGDAQVSYVIERFLPEISSFVSWNAKHFLRHLPIECMTPKECL